MAHNETVWTKFECPTSGARWTASNPLFFDKVCTFAGCGCMEKVKTVGTTTNGSEAHKWFRRPDGSPAIHNT